MDYIAEYNFRIKINHLFLPDNLTQEEIEKKVIEVGRRECAKFLSGYLIDPEKKVITEKVSYNKL